MLATLHRLASYGPVYDFIQTVAGVKLLHRRFRRVLSVSPPYQTVLDIGGGTGRIQTILASGSQYYCLDNEAPKLRHLLARNQEARAILGDAAQTPIADASVDLVLCTLVTHHLTDIQLQQMLSEIKRVLRPGGRLLFSDATWLPSWLSGRLLWSIDRGSNPRSKEVLLDVLSSHLRIVHREEFRLAHEYILVVAVVDEA